ncbi:MAG TPA: HEAT repeat domain-containing protein [Allosphingosinicella sp.]
MRRTFFAFLLLFLPLPSAAATGQAPAEAAGAACATVDSCIADLIAAARSRRQVGEPVIERLVGFGGSGADALVPLLMHEDLYVRESAGLALAGFRRIDPRHLPALTEAWRRGDIVNRQGRGNGWLPRAIAATGTEAALTMLWEDFLRDPQTGSNAQVVFALADFGAERIRPLVLKRFEECRSDPTGLRCAGLSDLLSELRPAFPAWSVAQYVELAAGAASDEVREGAEAQLVALRHPAGLPAFQRRLAAAAGAPDEAQNWYRGSLIAGLAGYGPAARASGPLIARFLGASYDEDLRAKAALALGQIGDASSADALLAIEADLGDDWLLAYNVAESLGRLRSAEARPLLGRLARGHWHRGVRNNAARALAMIDGGEFARPGIPGDGSPYPPPRSEQGEEYLYFGDLRFSGDDAVRGCSFGDRDRTSVLSQDPVAAIRWPRRGKARLEIAAVGRATAADVRRYVPERLVQGSVMAVSPVRRGRLAAFNGGEFGGGLYYLPEDGPVRALFSEPVRAAWRMGGRLYVAAGLAHLVLDRGHLYVVDPRNLRVERVVRLPASPRRISVSSRRAVIVETNDGAVAVGEDGRLVAPERIADCAAG